MPKRSLDFGEQRLRLLGLVADAYDVPFDAMIHRLIDLGLSVLPPVVPPHWTYLLQPQDNSASPPAIVTGTPPADDTDTDKGEPAGPATAPSPHRQRAIEIAWRVDQCFEAYSRQYVKFRQHADGLEVPKPKWSEHLRPIIREALERHDADLLGADQREQWSRESRCRAAARGIFLDPWFTGKDEKANGKRYIEPERCWRPLQGKVDPVPGFAEAYFTEMQRVRGGAQ